MVTRSKRPATDKQRQRLEEMKVFVPANDAQCGMLLRYLGYPENIHYSRLRRLQQLRQKIVVVTAQGHAQNGQNGKVVDVRVRTKPEIENIRRAINGQHVNQIQVKVELTANPTKFCWVAPSAVKIKPRQTQKFLFDPNHAP